MAHNTGKYPKATSPKPKPPGNTNIQPIQPLQQGAVDISTVKTPKGSANSS